MLLGVDVGGTFTDFALLRDGRLQVYKLPTTAADQALAFLAGLRELGVEPGARVAHGSTVATNALLERKGGGTALITTAGFADVLEIGRQNRPQLYALEGRRPPPLVPALLRCEVAERVDAQGNVLIPLDLAQVRSLAAGLAQYEPRIEALAVCLLFSFLHPQHEQQVRQAIAEAVGPQRFTISLSCEVLPEYREYERTSATVINAYVAPAMHRYLAHLQSELAAQGIERLLLMQSSGGLAAAQQARTAPARLVLSGPAAGVRGAFAVAQAAGFAQAITLDMGGTSSDVSLLPGRIQTTAETIIAGLPLRLPMIDIHTVGAGGGSLARLDAGGALRVGPESAGAEPGPICYGRGGSVPAVTDANLALGRLLPQHFLGGRMALDAAAALAALEELGQSMGAGAQTAALGIVRVVNATMERAIRAISVERGFDPRRFTLLAFGGAGPLHACELAAALDMPRVLIPRYPGILCALGLLAADLSHDLSQTLLMPLAQADPAQLTAQFAPLIEQGRAAMTVQGMADGQVALELALDMRYIGQSYELAVPVGSLGAGRAQSARLRRLLQRADLGRRFHTLHRQRYGHANPARPVELVNLRLRALGRLDKPPFIAEPEEGPDARSALLGETAVTFGAGQAVSAALYERASLRPGNHIEGPAIVVQMDATTVLPPGWQGRVDGYHNLILTRD